MITEDYCSYEVAKLLKEKGFDAPCRSYYTDYEDYIDFSYCNDELTDLQMGVWETLRPTHQMAMKWLREKGVYFSLVPFIENVGWPKDTWHINFYNSDGIMGGGFPVKGYEQAVEAALKYSLENLI